MKALVDADIFQWEFGNATDDEGAPLSWPLVQARIQSRLDRILESTGSTEYQCYITSDDRSNFRYRLSTIKPYKGNRRDIEKPRYYNHIRNFLKDHRRAIEVHGMEADDAICIEQLKYWKKCKWSKGLTYDTWERQIESQPLKNDMFSIICSRDKDLDMVPGWHYSWECGKQKEKQLWWQNELEGLKCFYKQCLLGDSVDNIPGLYGVGKSSKLLSRIDDCSSELAMYELVHEEYSKRFGSYADQFLLENGRLLWMLREEGAFWNPPEKEVNESSKKDNIKEEY